MSEIGKRKDEHLDLAAHGDVAFRGVTTLLEDVRLVHDALPDLDWAELDTTVEILGKRLRAPLLIAGMTGGTDRAKRINRELASLAEERGYAFGLGSQRPMLKDEAATDSYTVRDVAPNVLLLGNIGMVQASQLTTDQLAELVHAVGADAVCLHLNPAQELVQNEGDRDFRGGVDTFARLSSELPLPVVAKETGCGISGDVARRLRRAGVRHVDVSGAGGTSWVAVETQRASAERRGLGETFWDWGIPTAASLIAVAGHGFETVFATGGIQTGLDVAKCLALGASAAGFARPVLRALETGGREAAAQLLERTENELRTAMLLVGARDIAALRRVPRILVGELRNWAERAG